MNNSKTAKRAGMAATALLCTSAFMGAAQAEDGNIAPLFDQNGPHIEKTVQSCTSDNFTTTYTVAIFPSLSHLMALQDESEGDQKKVLDAFQRATDMAPQKAYEELTGSFPSYKERKDNRPKIEKAMKQKMRKMEGFIGANTGIPVKVLSQIKHEHGCFGTFKV